MAQERLDPASESSFEALYRQLRPVLHRFARDGRERLKKTLQWAAILGLVAVLAGIFLYTLYPDSATPFLPLAGVALFIGIGYARAHATYRTDFKEQVVRPIVSHFDPSLVYRPEGSITRREYQAADLFRQRIDRFRGEDLIEGRVGGTAIRFSELHVQTKRESGSGKNKRTEWVTVFRGVFVVAEFPKQFHGRTVVLPDRAQRLFGSFGQTLQSMNFTRGKLIKLEDPEFERLFAVYGDDQIEARYLLSTSLMQRILDFRRKLDHDVYLSFAQAQLFIALPSSRDRLEPPSLLQLLSYGRSQATEDAVLRHIGEYMADLQLVLGIVEDLNLNRRIWG